ncbi:TSUP family transporter [Pseudotabrizicola sp. 4114]|uniref:TSUP family transporter n=1 Tax=Pseudotabrizicola sp. 4114 TaxID=2817731 RepID=UPI002865AB5B|nr:putative membrane protein YfcA [Pseudorhodobacter sp. 4114]
MALIGTVMFLRAGRLSMRAVWPFAILGFPFSMLGGAVQLPGQIYFPVVGIVLILSALQMARSALRKSAALVEVTASPPFLAALLTGAVIGFVSGTTGTGGGVFLAPIILAMRWGTAHQTGQPLLSTP